MKAYGLKYGAEAAVRPLKGWSSPPGQSPRRKPARERHEHYLADKGRGHPPSLIRGFINFETHEHKPIQIILAGQLELRDKLNMKKNKAAGYGTKRIKLPVQVRYRSQTVS